MDEEERAQSKFSALAHACARMRRMLHALLPGCPSCPPRGAHARLCSTFVRGSMRFERNRFWGQICPRLAKKTPCELGPIPGRAAICESGASRWRRVGAICATNFNSVNPGLGGARGVLSKGRAGIGFIGPKLWRQRQEESELVQWRAAAHLHSLGCVAPREFLAGDARMRHQKSAKTAWSAIYPRNHCRRDPTQTQPTFARRASPPSARRDNNVSAP